MSLVCGGMAVAMERVCGGEFRQCGIRRRRCGNTRQLSQRERHAAKARLGGGGRARRVWTPIAIDEGMGVVGGGRRLGVNGGHGARGVGAGWAVQGGRFDGIGCSSYEAKQHLTKQVGIRSAT